MTTVLAVTAATWGVLMAVSPVLQIRSMRTHRSSTQISIGYLQVLFVGFVLWLSYGIAIRNPAMIVANAAAVVFGAATIVVARYYRR